MKHIFLLLLFNFSYQLVAQDFVKVEKGTIDLTTYKSYYKEIKQSTADVPAFEGSSLVTCDDYNKFYLEMHQHFGALVARSLLPDIKLFNGMQNPEEALQNYMNSFEGNNFPIIGISWTNAMLYCGWKWAKSEDYPTKYRYRLPFLTELIRINSGENMKLKSHNDYAEWTLTPKDESMYIFNDIGINLSYRYNAMPNDAPSMKRKVVAGSSHLTKSKGADDDLSFSYYQDSGYRHVGFRMARASFEAKEIENAARNYYSDYYKWINADLYNGQLNDEPSSITIDGLAVKFSEHKGRLHGNYQSSYKKGKTKAEGTYVYGVKTGVWKYYNENGEKVFEEKYLDHLAPFNNDYASFEDPILRELNKFPYHMPQRNEKGFVDYFNLKERAYIWSRRQWCKIEPENNDMMFGADRLFSVLNDLAQDESIVIYDSTDDQFTKQLNAEDYKKRVNSSTKVAYYEIKEDFFFDNDRYTSEHRIITLTPFVVSEGINDGKPYKLCHLYYPELREHLAKHPVNTYNLRITNLDDIFYFRDFDYSVVGTSSIYGRRSKSINANNRFEERIKAIEQAHSVLIDLK